MKRVIILIPSAKYNGWSTVIDRSFFSFHQPEIFASEQERVADAIVGIQFTLRFFTKFNYQNGMNFVQVFLERFLNSLTILMTSQIRVYL